MRPVSAVIAVIACVGALLYAYTTLSILHTPSFTPSAIQVTQVHSEAQTTLLIGILIVLTTISLSLAGARSQAPTSPTLNEQVKQEIAPVPNEEKQLPTSIPPVTPITPAVPPEQPPNKNGFSTTQWIAIASIAILLILVLGVAVYAVLIVQR